MVNQGHTNVER